MSVNGRVLACTACGCHIRVYEACHGALTDTEHEWIDPAEYVCGGCLEQHGTVTELHINERAFG